MSRYALPCPFTGFALRYYRFIVTYMAGNLPGRDQVKNNLAWMSWR